LISTVHDRAIQPETNEIYLHSHISNDEEEAGVDYRSSVGLIKNLRILEKMNDNPILVHLHMPGGYVADGFAMYDAISQSKNNITILGYSEICSMSSLIFQAADCRILMPSVTFMVHKMSLSQSMTPIHGARSSLQHLELDYRRMLNCYANKCVNGQFFKEKGYTASRVRSYLDKKISHKLDWYMDAEEALFYGFADGILGSKEYSSIKAIHS
jgi:ATP-dependent Clp protease protease subunit